MLHELYKKRASSQNAARANPRETVPMQQKKDVRIEREQAPLLHVARVHARTHGSHSPSARPTVEVHKSEI